LIVCCKGRIFFDELIGGQDLLIIIVLIMGIDDGLAEQVGIYWGKKKYFAPS
jgi:dolichol kinase